jgi:DNA-binding transcriptional regulator YiaG
MVTIQELRKQSGMSQKQFADYLEIPVATIRNWEQGRRVPPDYIINLIAKVMDKDFNKGGKR